MDHARRRPLPASPCLRRVLVAGVIASTLAVSSVPGRAETSAGTRPRPGESHTLLRDGRWLIIGGAGPRGPLATLAICDPITRIRTSLPAALGHARAWHSATTLADGAVLIAGGVGTTGIVAGLELFDPDSETVRPAVSWIPARAGHSATLLGDGRVLIAGGVTEAGIPVETVELWGARDAAVLFGPKMLIARYNHRATMLADGRVMLSGGMDALDRTISLGEIMNPATEELVPEGSTDGSPAETDQRPPC